MGNYNPNAPIILGQEWVPILNNDTTFSPAINSQEQGHGFTLTTARQASRARFYVNQLPGAAENLQTSLVSIYPQGQEALSGPILQVLIPVSQGVLTGAGAHLQTAAGLPPTVATALRTPGDGGNNAIFFDNTSAFPTCDLNFDTPEYPQLSGKRILNVSMVYSGYVTDQDASATAIKFVNPTPGTNMTFVNFLGNNWNPSPAAQETGALTLNTELSGTAKPIDGPINEMNLGDLFMRSASGAAVSVFSATPVSIYPWTYADLLRLHQSSASPLTLQLQGNTPVTAGGPNTVQCFIDYVALKVTYCEETRVAYGARFGAAASQQLGMQEIVLGAVNTKAANPILPAGNYTMTLTYVNPGAIGFSLGVGTETAKLNACTQLYPIISHPGVLVNIPFPLDDHIGDTLTRASTQILTQLSLHATGGTLTEPHVYGRQIAAQVYGSNLAQQTIYDDIVGVATPYPQVRYYARRFGSTTVPLLLSSTSPPISGATNQVSITPSDFDALPEIVDGWREVTLRFPSAPSMGVISPDPVWQWSAAGELAGNRWEILGACAPAITGGVPGTYFAQVPAPDLLGSATYQPPVGATAGLVWIPQGCGSPFVTGATLDPKVDATLLFSQDPPTVTGLAVSTLSQTVTGIGLNCGSLPCCIPSGLSYNRLTWSAAALAVSGFGQYELQRLDTVDGVWQTIMLTSAAAAVTGTTAFNDYEARVGVSSVYRIRVLNLYNFAGAWSSQVTGSPPAPGVSGGCADMTGALIFTTNAAQQGNANAAYIMQWESDTPEESFSLPEAGEVIFQQFYNRDGSVAFHGTERGLETFQRLLLISGGALALESMANGKTIRDLAWGNYPYICVRDDLGNRWFATVQIPAISVRNNRQAYMATAVITETTQTPFAVSP